MNSIRNRISALALCALVALLAGSTHASAQVVAKMTGVVLDEEGNPLKGAKVYVKDVTTNNVVRPAVTSKEGKFTYTSLPPKTYIFWAELEGYMLARIVVRLTGGDGSRQEQYYFYDDKQDFKDEVRVIPTSSFLSRNEFEFTMTTPDKHTALVNRLYAEYKGEDATGGEAAAADPAATEKNNYMKGMDLVGSGDLQAAVPFLKLAIDETDDAERICESRYQIGKALLEGGDLDGALASLLEAQKTDPTKGGVAFYLARVYNEKGMKAEATEQLELELALNPDSEAVLQNLAGFYADTGETEKAIETYEGIIAMNAENFEAYQQLAALYKTAGNREMEAKVYARMGDKDPTGTSFYNLGNIAFNADDREKAKFYYERVIEKNPRHAMAHYQLANTLLGMGDIAGAATHFEQFAKLAPKDPRAAEAQSTASALKEMLKG